MGQVKKCKNCGSLDLVKNRRICKQCDRERVKSYYHEKGGKEKREAPNCNCEACDKLFTSWRKTQTICPDCYRLSLQTGFKKNQYGKENREHRAIAENVLGYKLNRNDIVHHVDEDPKNNSLENLWVMSRYNHGKLHKFLRLQKVVYEKSLDKQSVNCWNILRVEQTKAWLEIAGANVIKLHELDNQQPSP